MKPENADEVNIKCDLSETSFEYAASDLMEKIGRRHEDPLAVRYEVKVCRGDVCYAARVLERHRVPFRAVDHYDRDEWSVVARAYFLSEPNIVRKEIWSPGA